MKAPWALALLRALLRVVQVAAPPGRRERILVVGPDLVRAVALSVAPSPRRKAWAGRHRGGPR